MALCACEGNLERVEVKNKIGREINLLRGHETGYLKRQQFQIALVTNFAARIIICETHLINSM